MSNITVAEILKLCEKWTRSKEFHSKVMEKLKISDKMAYLKIKEALKNKEILKQTLPDRTVLYGLPEFGLPKTEEKPSTENYTLLGSLQKASECWVQGRKLEAEKRMLFVLNALKLKQQTPMLKRLIAERDKLLKSPLKLSQYPPNTPFSAPNFEVARDLTPRFLEELYRILG